MLPTCRYCFDHIQNVSIVWIDAPAVAAATTTTTAPAGPVFESAAFGAHSVYEPAAVGKRYGNGAALLSCGKSVRGHTFSATAVDFDLAPIGSLI